MSSLRTRSILALGILVVLTLLTTYSLRTSFSSDFNQVPEIIKLPSDPVPVPAPTPEAVPPEAVPPEPETKLEPEPAKHIILDHPIYKPVPGDQPPPIVDNFPLAAAAHSAKDLPPIPPWNNPPNPHVPEKTPLFIGFTRNWRLLQQTVVSYITAGWPPEDIYVVENTGTMKSNELGLLSLQNPFFLNHTRLHMFGVNIITTPTLFSFSQLQNFFIWTAIENNYTEYFWGHMDVVAISLEDRQYPHIYTESVAPEDQYTGFPSLYTLAVRALRNATSPEHPPWGIRYFSYDRLALVNRKAYETTGAWDTTIPYYMTDCDFHDRLTMHGFLSKGPDIDVGNITDVAGSLDDLLVLYRKQNTGEPSFVVDGPTKEQLENERLEDAEREKERLEKEKGKVEENLPVGPLAKRAAPPAKWVSDAFGSDSYKKLIEVTEYMLKRKNIRGGGGRNTWQRRQTGGKGEPFYRDPEGFERAIQMMTQNGKDIYAEKWGHRDCGLLEFGRKAGDEWRVERDWE